MKRPEPVRKRKFIEILLSGGVCSGKTNGLRYFVRELRKLGFRVFSVPEIATLFFIDGIPDIARIARFDRKKYLELEKQIFATQIFLRKIFRSLASTFPSDKVVILYDRGEMDIMIYAGRKKFMAMMKEAGLSVEEVRDSYDVIIHLETAAKGAEMYYARKNNKARRQSLKEAHEDDDRMIEAWQLHPNFHIIDNKRSRNFRHKLQRAFEAVRPTLRIN